MATDINRLIAERSPYVTVAVAATTYLFKNVRTVRLWCQNGRFKRARKMGQDWQIERTELMEFIARSYPHNQP